MELMEIRCKRCGAPIPKRNIDRELALATCEHCGTVFGLRLPTPEEEREAPRVPERPPVPMPERFEIAETGSALRITYQWFNWTYVMLMVFAVFWNGFMVVWNVMGAVATFGIMNLFGLLHTAVGIGMAYYALVGLINSTTIWVTPGVLKISHHPLPWFGAKEVRASAIRQLYAKEVIRSTKNGTSRNYQVHAVLEGEGQEKLLQGLAEAEQALYIEQEIERYLGIEDRPMATELPRW